MTGWSGRLIAYRLIHIEGSLNMSDAESGNLLVPTEAIRERPPWVEWYCLQFAFQLFGGTILAVGTGIGLSFAACPAIFYPVVSIFFKELLLAVVSIQLLGGAITWFSEIFAPGGKLAIWAQRSDLALIEKALKENASTDAAKNLTRLLWLKPKLKPAEVRTVSGWSNPCGTLLSYSTDETYMHVASANGLIKILKKIISVNTDVNVACLSGTTPLHLAARFGHTEVVKLLIKRGADVNLPDGDGCTALHYASQAGYKDTVVVLLKSGASRGAANSAGQLPLDLTRDKGVALALTSKPSIIHRLLTTIKPGSGEAGAMQR